MSSPILQTEHFNFIPNYDYGENLATVMNTADQGNICLEILNNESYGIEWINIVFSTYNLITLSFPESVKDINGISHPYDIKQTLEVWYDTTTGNPSLTHTFYDWNTEYRIGNINITSKLVGYNVDLSRVKKVRYTTYDGTKDYVNHPTNNFTLESFYRYIYGIEGMVKTEYYLLVPDLSVSPTNLSYSRFGGQKIFTIDSDIE